MAQDGKKPKLTELGSQYDVYKYYAPEQSNDDIPSYARYSLRDDIEKKKTKKKLRKLPRWVPPKAKKKLKLRTKKEIFGSKECQKWYMEKVSEALEKKGDLLYDFIRAHSEYSKTSHVSWNKDFAAFVGLDPNDEKFKKYKGATEAITNRRITAAAQHVLVEKYDNDIFRLTYTKKQFNPWIFVDGKMGPYSVSVLDDYWMATHSKNSKKKPKPPGRSGLDDKDYKPGSASAKTWDKALEHLDIQTENGPVEEDSPEEKPFKLSEAQEKNFKKIESALKKVLGKMKMNLSEDQIRMLSTHITVEPDRINSLMVIVSLKKMINAGQITDEEIGEARKGKGNGTKKPAPKEKPKAKPKVKKGVAPPKKFDPKKIDYSQGKEILMLDLGKAIEHVKSATGWTQLEYKIIDENTIELSRADSSSKIQLHRKGKEWAVGEYYQRRSLMQAVVLGNLKNKVEHIIVSNKHEGAKKRPFEADGGNIDFDRNWNPVDLRILNKETGWLRFYSEVGVIPGQVAAMLNNWHEQEIAGVKKIKKPEAPTKPKVDKPKAEPKKTKPKAKPKKKPAPKKKPEKEFDAKDKKALKRYKKLDRGGKIPLSELAIDSYVADEGMPLSVALGNFYDEEPDTRDRDESKRLFRVLYLVAQKVGAKIDKMLLKEGDTLRINRYGLSITDSDNELRYPKVYFDEEESPKRVAKKKVAQNKKSADAKAKKKYRKLDEAGKIPLRKLAIDRYEADERMSLHAALEDFYDEDIDDPEDSPNLFRTLNLVARKVGAKVDNMYLEEGDTLSIIRSGRHAKLSITDSEYELRYPEIEIV